MCVSEYCTPTGNWLSRPRVLGQIHVILWLCHFQVLSEIWSSSLKLSRRLCPDEHKVSLDHFSDHSIFLDAILRNQGETLTMCTASCILQATYALKCKCHFPQTVSWMEVNGMCRQEFLCCAMSIQTPIVLVSTEFSLGNNSLCCQGNFPYHQFVHTQVHANSTLVTWKGDQLNLLFLSHPLSMISDCVKQEWRVEEQCNNGPTDWTMQSFLGVLLHCSGETHDLSNFRTICKNSYGLMDEVPTRKPPTFPDSNIPSQLFEDTEPPYKYLT